MEHSTIDLEEQIERCRRLSAMLTDIKMRRSLEALADHYEAKLKRADEGGDGGEGFMLRRRFG